MPVTDIRGENASNELKTELAVIFKKIGDKKTTQSGIESLYQFQQDHPDVDVKPFLGNTSAAFQAYIEKGLKSIRDKRKTLVADPMELDEPAENVTDAQITVKESPDDRYNQPESEISEHLPPPRAHQSVNIWISSPMQA